MFRKFFCEDCIEDMWMLLLIAAVVVGLLIATYFCVHPKEYRDIYLDTDQTTGGIYRVMQYVRYSHDIALYTSTNPEDALRVYKELKEKQP